MTGAATPLLATPLRSVHLRLGGRMVDFAGWDMPVQYPGGIVAEHHAVRQGCGLFDLSHMGRVYVRGAGALALSQQCMTRDLTRVEAGQAAYGLLCRDDGGILDDVIAYVLAPEELLFVFNASNREKDVAWFQEQRQRLGLQALLDDDTFQTALIGVQGPNGQRILQRLTPVDLGSMPGYSFRQGEVAGREALIARTGYTGEDGFELCLAAVDAEAAWMSLLDGGNVTACGLGARDTLRTEAGMPLYGHEIDEATNPYEAGLGWAVQLGKGDFSGRERLAALKEAGPSRKLVGLLVEEGGVPRPGHPIVSREAPVGQVTSGTFSPTLKRNIAMGYVSTAAISDELAVEIRGKAVPATIVPLPFVPHHSRPRAPRT